MMVNGSAVKDLKRLHALILLGVVLSLLVPVASASHFLRNDRIFDTDDVLRDAIFRNSGSRLDLDLDRDLRLGSDFRRLGGFGLGGFDRDDVIERSVTRDVDLDEDSVLAALILGNVDFEDIADVRFRDDVRIDRDRSFGLDRDDALFALALSGGRLGRGVFFGSDFDDSSRRIREIDRDVRIDPDDALLALALDRSPRLGDIASFDIRTRDDRFFDRDLDLDRRDTLSLLALGR